MHAGTHAHYCMIHVHAGIYDIHTTHERMHITIDSTARIIAMSALNIEEIEASIKSSSINIENLKHKLDELEALKKEE